ncbi:MAG: UDP-N-acetylmuramoyl-L-alanyl-D-glutamate--2,6-diaminopimelate ligase [Acidimicrobiia bacterium]
MAPEGTALRRLASLVGGRVVGDADIKVWEVTHDSRRAGRGVLFVAIPGFSADGHDFVERAVGGGAAAVCVERDVAVAVPRLVVVDTRAAVAELAAEVHGRPSQRLKVVGVTGTNGKTTVAHLIESIVNAAGLESALTGTVGARIRGREVPISLTSPEASDLQRLLAAMVDEGVDVATVEVSSHALSLGRVGSTRFEVAAFTNLSQDHLDFHSSMEGYFAAKASLFVPERVRRAVVWVDDSWGRRLLTGRGDLPVTTVGMSAAADVSARDITLDLTGSRFTLVTRRGEVPVMARLAGDFNVANAAVAAACAAELDIDLDTIAAGIAALPMVPGRFEVIDTATDFWIVVDYAHTPDGIASVVSATRRLCAGRILAVVGAGGDRDRAKRPLMGRAAAAADLVVVTSDNPRSEDPASIVAAVAEGAWPGRAEVIEEPDRRRAIRRAVELASSGDVILVLGKGHEQGQEFADGVVPFDDRAVARQEVRAR